MIGISFVDMAMKKICIKFHVLFGVCEILRQLLRRVSNEMIVTHETIRLRFHFVPPKPDQLQAPAEKHVCATKSASLHGNLPRLQKCLISTLALP